MKSLFLVLTLGLFASPLISCSSKGGGTATDNRPPATPALTGKGDPNGAPTQAMIGAAGGQVASSDGVLTLIIPPGALAAETSIGIQPISNLAPGGLGASYRLTPDGQAFTAPVQVVFAFKDSELGGSALAALRVGYQDPKGQWRTIKSVERDAAGHNVKATTKHFSDWSRMTAAKLTPPSASIQTGMSVNLRLDVCRADPSLVGGYDDELSTLLLNCQQSSESAPWAANGVAGGSTESGTVTEVAPGDAAYVAPNVTPSVNPVAVSATINDTDGFKLILVSNITVGTHPSWQGTSRTDTTMTTPGAGTTKIVVDATVRWVWSEVDQGWHATGAVSYSYDLSGGGCTTTALVMGVVSGADGTLSVFDMGSGKLQYAGGGATNLTLMGTSDCNGTHTPMPAFISMGPTTWWTAPAPYGDVSMDGRTIAGSTHSPAGQNPQVDAQWSFTQE